MKPVLSNRLGTYRSITKTPWAYISDESGLSVRTLIKCADGKFSPRTNETLSDYLAGKENMTRRCQNLNDPRGRLKYYINYLNPEWKAGSIVDYLDKPYFVMEPPLLNMGNPINGAIYIPDDRLEATFPKGSLVGLHWIKDKDLIHPGHWYMVIDFSLNMFFGLAFAVWPKTTIELIPENKSFPSFYIHKPNIMAVFAIRKPIPPLWFYEITYWPNNKSRSRV